MKFSCTQSELNTHLSLVSRAVPSRPSHPVLANVLVVVDADTQRVTMTGFDLSLGVQTVFPAQVEAGGRLTLPAKLLSDIVSRLPAGEVTVSHEDHEAIAILTCAAGSYTVRGMGADDYPELPVIETAQVSHLPVDALIDGLRGSLFATSADESKQVLTGVHLALDADRLEFAATDGHRLAVVQTPIDQAGDSMAADNEALNVTVPGKALRELERMLQMPQAGEAIAVRVDQSQLVIQWDNQQLTSRLLEGQYPNYRQLIPQQFGLQMTVDRRSFTAALERIAVLADQRNSIVKLELDADRQELVLSVDAQDIGSAREAIVAQISGDSLEAAFNVKYLLEGLKALPANEVQMQFNSPTSPAILTPLGGVKMTYLVMPVQIRN
jgi:DNA polymerase-3 subunit beta